MVQRIAINNAMGGFHLNPEAISRLQILRHPAALANPGDAAWGYGIARDDPLLIKVIEDMEGKAGDYIIIVEIPDGIEWRIIECDGREWLTDKNRTWPPED